MNPSGIPWVPSTARPSLDTVLSLIHKGSTLYWLNSRGNGNYAKFIGTVDQPFKKSVLVEPMYQAFKEPAPTGLPDGTRAKYWIVNTYQKGGLVLAFVHVEHTNLATHSVGQGRIGLATSEDYGNSFTYIGDIMSPHVDSAVNVEGAPYIIKDGYFYVYAKELCSPSDANGFGGATIVVRARVDDVLAAARKGKVTPWQKYDDGSWDSAGLGGPCTGVSISPDGIDHTDAAYSTYTKSYFMTLSMNNGHGRRNTWINLYESSDGIHWELAKKIVEQPPEGVAVGFQYVTIVNADGSKNAEVGKKFYIYSGGESGSSGAEGVVYRWTVTLN